jgi:rRNA pseudouridine-1189 N-methylase Emg1 (Nep1/Mra1 family)
MVSNILKEKGFSDDYQLVGLFHDLLEDTSVTYSELLKLSNKEIADAVKLLTKEATTNKIKEYYDNEDFNSDDVYDISKGTTKEDELFDYAEIPDYLKTDKDNKVYEKTDNFDIIVEKL